MYLYFILSNQVLTRIIITLQKPHIYIYIYIYIYIERERERELESQFLNKVNVNGLFFFKAK